MVLKLIIKQYKPFYMKLHTCSYWRNINVTALQYLITLAYYLEKIELYSIATSPRTA